MTFSIGMRHVSFMLFFMLIFALIFLVPGCGPSAEQASAEQLAAVKVRLEKKRKEDAEIRKKELAKKKKEQARKKREAEKRRKEATAQRRRGQNRNRVTEHPARFENWTDKDFYVAKVEKDKRLSGAVDFLAKACEDTSRAVRVLRELITPGTPLTPEELEEVGVRSGYKYDKQVKSLARAIVGRDTEEAIALLEKIMTREVPTDAPGVALPAVMQAIAEYPTERNEPIFLDAFRRGDEDAGRLLATILADGASESFRLTLAEYSMAASCAPSQRRTIWDLLCKEEPKNLPATLFLYRNDRLPESYCRTLERQFARLAQAAVTRVCGFPVDSSDTSKKRQKRTVKIRQASARQPLADTELIAQVQANLWNDAFADLLAKRLYQVDSLEEDNQLILLAMNTPREKPRKMLADLLLRNWQETPAKLGEIGFPERVVAEPGFWVVAKWVLHKNEGGAGQEGGVRPQGQRSRARGGRHEVTTDPVLLAWKQAFGRMLVKMCERFEAAGRPVYSQDEVTGASTGMTASTETTTESSSGTVSMKSLLHAEARPVTECKIRMPDDSLSVHYLRCEEVARPEAVLNHYRAKLDGAGELSGPHLCWLGTLTEATATEGETPRFCSTDVLLKIDPNTEAAHSASGKFEVSIEILLITSE